MHCDLKYHLKLCAKKWCFRKKYQNNIKNSGFPWCRNHTCRAPIKPIHDRGKPIECWYPVEEGRNRCKIHSSIS